MQLGTARFFPPAISVSSEWARRIVYPDRRADSRAERERRPSTAGTKVNQRARCETAPLAALVGQALGRERNGRSRKVRVRSEHSGLAL